ncbi:sodium ion-translocating decarboxylase subunit beta [Trichococcus pasteurii]|uniref:Na+-transporting methylmalonyl-coa/oxaloacetate decarboxylase beta subunit n=1 Tax=Trichococcus pasteurii TaxID=43064 RepID=A0A1W1IK38_9LACT|nr:sodium ion-translocating decarboxylase subunit beta [Trichococcus pasteurii]SFF00243.1 sodium ion-translocating decarboxylase, beta subunit [Trichococcus pasteurii]SLM53103.1 na+-transporting methylmalonyl-coa/oxaloacetate decarboxylase beta subunit [Trichococcus pasteurii]SSB93984.1 na+-transporting methylmalonyl-coa/oxaloacetate decarboxylase beta subunit [Trichococcus pasteurii]
MIQALTDLIRMSGLAHLTYKEIIMIIIACIFLYLAIKKGYEPYLLLPIAFGILLVNLPLAGLMAPPTESEPGGLIYYLYQGTNLGIYPPLIFLCLGAATDFGPLIANPKTLLLGGAAQFGIFAAFFGALALGMTPQEAASVGIIGGADGPTAIYLTTKLANHLLSVIALAAYSYMALVPLIQPPIMRLLTTEKERQTVMKQMRVVSKNERILFPIITTIFVSLVVPSATALVGMLMLGNLIRESGQVPKLTETLQNAMMYTITVILGVTVGAKANGELFLSLITIKIIILGLFAFAVGTAAGVLMGKLMYKLTNGKVNPLIGAAGVSAVPMAARVVQKEGIKYNPSNYLLMHAMGPNVAGVIGSAVAAGVLLAFFG